jgi:CBS domain-containing protein
MGTKVSSVLKNKGYDVVTVAPQQTVASVVKVLTQNRIGAAPVINEEGQLIRRPGRALEKTVDQEPVST